MTPLTDLEYLTAEACRRDFHTFFRESWHVYQPEVYRDAWHIGAVCEALQAVQAREIRDLVICKPPGTSKSRVLSIAWPVWLWVKDPAEKVLIASYGEKVLTDFGNAAYKLATSEWFQRMFPGRVHLRTKAVLAQENTAMGWRKSTTVPMGQVTGMHGTIRVVDDPLKPDEVDGAGLEASNNWFGQTWYTRTADASRLCDVVSQQRLADGDMVAQCLERGFTPLMIQMRYSKEYSFPCARDPRTEEGQLLDPVRFPEEYLAKLQKQMSPADVAAQFQQDPVPAGGSIIKEAWLGKRWSGDNKDLPKGGMWLHSWDCAFKDEDSSDYVVGQVWYIKWPNCYLVQQYRGHWSFVDTCKQVLAARSAYPTQRVLVEDKANGTAVISTLAKSVAGLIAINPEGGKVARANAVSGLFEAGQVWLPLGRPWLEDYIYEVKRFPKAKKDDQVDSTTQALNWANTHFTDLTALSEGIRDPAMVRALLGLG